MVLQTIDNLRNYFINTPEEDLKFFLVDVFSWRGIYADVAFVPSKFGNKEESLDIINRALTEEFIGYKGGNYKYDEDTRIHFEYCDSYCYDSALYDILLT